MAFRERSRASKNVKGEEKVGRKTSENIEKVELLIGKVEWDIGILGYWEI